MVICEILGVI